ncbi:MAG TPA: aminotransferase class I/II-fold pyridoxal phosphate-dependent enzyme [Patescibacteria group bacterium]|nr:aminotransferase class I/II-fold pyridoxal phosphate-dependent enzyme [Patescibacteria group bacterium]
MRVEPFKVEKWLNEYELDIEVNISETCVDPFTLREFLSLMGKEDFFDEFQDTPLTYGYIPGSPRLRQGISDMYEGMGPDNILITGGAIGANFLAFYSLVEPGDTVISVHPTYQQLYSVAESFGANVKLLRMRMKDGWLPVIDELAGLVDDKTKLIVINNPNNPTGSLIDSVTIQAICEIAEEAGAYLLDDESYHGLYIDPDTTSVPPVVEFSESAIATGSFSKAFSLTGLRLGWIVADPDVISKCEDHRDYTTISNGVIDDALATLAVENLAPIRERNLGIVRENYKMLSDWVAEEPLIDWHPPQAGTIAFLRHGLGITSEELCERLIREKDVLLVPGTCFDHEKFLRIGFGNNREVLKEGLSRFKEFLDGYR